MVAIFVSLFFAFIVVASCFIPLLSMGKRLFLSRALEGIPLHGDCGVGQNTHRAHCTLGTSHAGAHRTSELIACRGAIKHHGAIANYGATASEIVWRRKTLNWSRARGERKRHNRARSTVPHTATPHCTSLSQPLYTPSNILNPEAFYPTQNTKRRRRPGRPFGLGSSRISHLSMAS